MNAGQIKKNKADYVSTVVGNRETVTLPQGLPAVFVMDGTNDGFDVQLPSSSTANKAASFPAGIILQNEPASKVGCNVLVYGICNKVLVSATLTRSATNAVWASQLGFGLGDVLTINTGANCLEFLSAGSAVKQQNNFVCAQTIVSVTTQASTLTFPQINSLGGASTDTIAYVTSLAKVFVRCM
jgi:hypothetical protein